MSSSAEAKLARFRCAHLFEHGLSWDAPVHHPDALRFAVLRRFPDSESIPLKKYTAKPACEGRSRMATLGHESPTASDDWLKEYIVNPPHLLETDTDH
jgi:hypothetical protein